MTGPVSLEKIVSASLKGIVKAQKDYVLWCNEWLWCAPEYLLTVYVAKEIAKLEGSKLLTLENSALAAIKDAGARGPGNLHSDIRENGRFDILLWWANGAPRAVIEIKNQVTNARKIISDVNRIVQVLHRNKEASSIDFGAIVFYTSLNDDKNKKLTAKEKLEKSMGNIEKSVKNHVGDSCLVSMHSPKIYEDEGSAWAGVVIILKPKNI